MAAFPTDEGDSFSSSTHKWDYDVFLSFRGKDTRHGFTGHLYQALCDGGFKTFFDNKDLQRGEEISAQRIKAIKSSMISIIIFSQNYAFSTWCREALTEILECKKNGQRVLPVFYKVDPSEVRKLGGSFKLAASLSGWHHEDGSPEYKCIKGIIRVVSITKLNRTELSVARYPTGIDSRAEVIESLLDIKSNDVRMVGIHGLGGIGKTTIAKAVYNRVADLFDGSSFLMNVRENSGTDSSIIKLQEQLLSEILGSKELKVHSTSRGINVIEERLSSKKILLILDDVDKLGQVENFLGKCDWLDKGSRVIITTRDRRVLATLEIDPLIYEVEQLYQHEALQLFSKCAFKKDEPEADYLLLTNQFISYASGLPLALEFIGYNLRARKNICQWENELEKYKNIPNKEIQNILKVSFDGLDKTEKDIFLDIACFFKGWSKNYVVDILATCNLYPDSGISNLIDKCLIRVESDELWMHDLIQQMGREIVRQESNVLGKRTRLWCYDDGLEVLTENTGSDEIRGIILCSDEPTKVTLAANAFKRMGNLKYLIVHNVHICKKLKFLPNGLRILDWPNYPFPLPSNFCPQKLFELKMPCSSRIRLETLFKQESQFPNLKRINFYKCVSITKVPNLCAPKLEELDLSYCKNLVECQQESQFQNLKRINFYKCVSITKVPNLCAPKLEELDLSYCKNLVECQQEPQFQNLKRINFYKCVSITKVPNLCAPKLEELDLSYCKNLVECHKSIGYLEKLQKLHLLGCEKLQNLPSDLMWKSLDTLNIFSCTSLDFFPFLFNEWPFTWYKEMKWFHGLYSYCCKNVVDLEDIIYKLPPSKILCIYAGKSRPWCGRGTFIKSYAFLDLSNVQNLDLSNVGNLIELDFLMKFDYFPVLEHLYLNEINIITIPESITKFTRLKTIGIKCCKYLREIPRLPLSIRGVYILNSHSIHPQSSNRLFNQFGEFCLPQQNQSDCEDYELILPGSEIPKWFNHQSVGNSISFWVGPDCDYLKFAYCVVLEPNEWNATVQVSLKFNGIKLIYWTPPRIKRITNMTCNHVCFFKVLARPWSRCGNFNISKRGCVDVEFGSLSHILRCGVHAECICPLVQHSFSNIVMPSPHLLNSCLELSHSNSMETTYNDFDSPLEGSHDDGCDSSLSLCTSPMGRNYLPPQPQVTVPDDTSHISLPKLRLGLPGLGVGLTASEGFHLGSSSMAHNFVSDDDSDFNLYSPLKKMRKS
ncbi:disease resistance protein RPV1-like isoform X5 [Quercus robur]|uniref:disease resistance protein RPV1-like isoform X4 n=1 Tax=Quercus robur TaxID=38942 RepID=UPI002162640D|nr:disease resistance protein RPV1-like isoform X4 [Quercus robur]XP_050260321.1 disease resistance protein RPV1-like isoform X5 [Quercus robur]